MLYFAYGSNLDPQQLHQRCPSARFVTLAKLPDHRLAFTRYAKDRGCGTCDGVPEPGQEIWGVVFDISEEDLRRMDESEGYQPGRPLNENAYFREQREVLRDGKQDEPVLVWLYFANRFGLKIDLFLEPASAECGVQEATGGRCEVLGAAGGVSGATAADSNGLIPWARSCARGVRHGDAMQDGISPDQIVCAIRNREDGQNHGRTESFGTSFGCRIPVILSCHDSVGLLSARRENVPSPSGF